MSVAQASGVPDVVLHIEQKTVLLHRCGMASGFHCSALAETLPAWHASPKLRLRGVNRIINFVTGGLPAGPTVVQDLPEHN